MAMISATNVTGLRQWKDVKGVPKKDEIESLDCSDVLATEWKDGLKDFVNLIHFFGTNSQLGSLDPVLTLTHLKVIDLSNNQIAQIPVEMKGLKNLEELNLSKNQLTEIKNVPPSIVRLDFSENRIAHVPDLRNCIHLVYLDVSKNLIQTLPQFIMEDCGGSFLSENFDLSNIISTQFLK